MNAWKRAEIHYLNTDNTLAHSPFIGVRKRLKDIVGKVIYGFWSALLRDANEPRVFVNKNRDQEIFYSVYDPVSGDFARLDSEDAVRAWLEQRYYR